MKSTHLTAKDTIAYLESLRYAIEQMEDEERRMWLGVKSGC